MMARSPSDRSARWRCRRWRRARANACGISALARLDLGSNGLLCGGAAVAIEARDDRAANVAPTPPLSGSPHFRSSRWDWRPRRYPDSRRRRPSSVGGGLDRAMFGAVRALRPGISPHGRACGDAGNRGRCCRELQRRHGGELLRARGRACRRRSAAFGLARRDAGGAMERDHMNRLVMASVFASRRRAMSSLRGVGAGARGAADRGPCRARCASPTKRRRGSGSLAGELGSRSKRFRPTRLCEADARPTRSRTRRAKVRRRQRLAEAVALAAAGARRAAPCRPRWYRRSHRDGCGRASPKETLDDRAFHRRRPRRGRSHHGARAQSGRRAVRSACMPARWCRAEILAHCPPGARIIDTAPLDRSTPSPPSSLPRMMPATTSRGCIPAICRSGARWASRSRRLDAPRHSLYGDAGRAVLCRSGRRARTRTDAARPGADRGADPHLRPRLAMPPGRTPCRLSRDRRRRSRSISRSMCSTRSSTTLTPHYGADCPVAVVLRASWPEQRIVRATLSTGLAHGDEAAIERTALILVGPHAGRARISTTARSMLPIMIAVSGRSRTGPRFPEAS